MKILNNSTYDQLITDLQDYSERISELLAENAELKTRLAMRTEALNLAEAKLDAFTEIFNK